METEFINPNTARPLRRDGDRLIDDQGNVFPIVAGVPRICEIENYTSSFGHQWNQFQTTQIDGEGVRANPSEVRLFAETGWRPEQLAGLDMLEVGSGAGRFSRVILTRTRANLFSVDFSSAVEANLLNNAVLGEGRFHLAQASIYEMPFPDDRFDKVLCLGVLQHTPNFENSVHALISKAKPGGEIVVDFYAIKGWWTKITAKYLLRPITKRMSHDRLLSLIEGNVDWLMAAANLLQRLKLGAFRRFLPIVDFKNMMPQGLTRQQLRQWVILDTFDMFSPEFDNPQRVEAVAKMFSRGGADVTFAGFIDSGSGRAAVVRGVKREPTCR